MANRWESRAEPNPGQGKLYWHILLGDHPQVQALASVAQKKLAAFPGLHLTPKPWLHLTILPVGFCESFTTTEIDRMVILTRELLSELPPATISFGRVFYHPEAIVLRVQTSGALVAVFNAVQRATCKAIGREKVAEDRSWVPHVTIAYSTAIQPADPIIATLGYKLSNCEATIDSIDLVVQEGAERLWNWRSIAKVPLGA